MLTALLPIYTMIHVQVESNTKNNPKAKMYKFDHQQPLGVKIFVVVHSLLAGVPGNNPSQFIFLNEELDSLLKLPCVCL